MSCSVFLIAVGILGVAGTVLVSTGNQQGESTAGGYVGLIVMLALGALGVFFLIPIWKGRRIMVSIDHTGLWFHNGTAQNVISWHTLAGVGLYWSEFGRRSKLYSLELCPNGPIDRDDPVLWGLVRDEEPPHPTLPRLRYRLPLTAATYRPVVAAVQQYVPQLWLGESQRESGHIGVPDRKGHLKRTRSRTY
ncbi:hypothetical protein [Streptomyces gobiensis]|uniref:hypothetical protein n=1 Tax=Streptomyces gobiensis TaxID=2875706 RepID=UPI001E4747EF|nr:hypothetical protein [Streptomyces gobiensis]UGY93925.1 hypothetical protein test1122_20860 [Streptomyces gobiensis]